MNIGLDARPLIKKKTGIGYYLENMLKNILKNDKKNKYYLFSNKNIIFDINNYKNVFIIKDSSNLKGTFWYLFKVPFIVKKYEIDVFWGTQNILPFNLTSNIKTILTVHDLVFYEKPKTMNNRTRLIYKITCPKSINDSNIIISDSYSTKDGIRKYFPKKIVNKKIDVIYLGADYINTNNKIENEFYNKYKNMPFIKNKNYILYVGTIEPRKNIDILLKAYDEIRKKINIKLILCGKVGWKCNDILKNIKKHEDKKNVFYFDYVTNQDKFLLMKNAFAFIFPSVYEGFGLPVVEAMKMGTISLTTRSSSLNELIDKNELKFDCNNAKELEKKVLNLYYDKKLYNSCKEYCKKRADFFSWEKAAIQFLELLNMDK